MPTYLVGPARAYTTIEDAFSAIPSPLTGTGVHEVIIDAGTYTDTGSGSGFVLNKGLPSASDYIVIRAASGDEHFGNINNGVRIHSTTNSRATLRIATAYTRVSNVIVSVNPVTSGSNGIGIDTSASSCTFSNVIGINRVGSGNGICFYGAGTYYCCLAINLVGSPFFTTYGFSTTLQSFYYNCGAYGFGLYCFLSQGASNSTAINCWAYRISGDGFSGFSSEASSNNASNDSTSPGANSLTNRTLANLAFFSVSNNNFHISQNSALFIAGSNQSALFTTDWDLEVIADWSIGPDAQSRASSVVVADRSFLVRQWPTPIIRPAIQWIQDSAGNWNGSDRGAAQDIYETEVVFFDTQDNIDTLMEALDDNREGITLSNFAVPFFSPEVDHTGSISATVVSFGPRRHLAWGAASKWVYELPVTFRAISPTLLGTSASLSTLKLQDGFEASASYEVGKAFTYGQTAVYADRRSDVGRFVGRFRQQTSQARAILAYLLTTARANTVAFPSLGGVTYPWGVNRGAPANCKVKSFSIRRVNFVFWDIEIEFVESV